MQTATTIARHARAKGPDALPELIELDTGRYSGERIRELRSIDPELYRRFRVHSWEVVPDAERIESLQRRAATAWAYLIDRAKAGHRCIVAVSHGGMLQWLIKATIGSDEQRWMPLFETSNCGIFLFRAQSTLPGHRHRVEQSISDSNAMAADDTDDEPSTDDARRDSSAGDAYAGRRPAHPPAADPLESGGVAPQPRPPSAGGVRPASEPPTRHPAAAPGGGASALGGGDEELPEPPPGEPEEHVPGTGYYGVWAHMNLVPY
jgi:broad specificity phosphatase PhoE